MFIESHPPTPLNFSFSINRKSNFFPVRNKNSQNPFQICQKTEDLETRAMNNTSQIQTQLAKISILVCGHCPLKVRCTEIERTGSVATVA